MRTTQEHETIEKLSRELAAIRSLLIGLVGKDSEGEYRPEFVERVLSLSREKAEHEFADADDFIKQIDSE